MAADPERTSTPAASLDYSNLGLFKLPGGASFLPGGGGVPGSALAHGDYVDLSSTTQTKNGTLRVAGVGGINLEYVNVKDYGTQTIGAMTSPINIPAVAASVTIAITTMTGAFVVGQSVTVWDYQYCFSGTVTAASSTSVTVQCARIWVGAAANVINTGSTQFFGSVQADDSAMLQAAIAAAGALRSATLYFPPGSFVTSTTLTLRPDVPVYSMASTIRPGGATVTDCFAFSAGESGDQFAAALVHTLPSVYYFTGGAGVRLTDNSLAYLKVRIKAIRGCLVGVGVYCSGNGTTGSFGITVDFETINGCTYAFLMQSTRAKDAIQGLVLRGVLIIGCTNGLYFQSTQATTTAATFATPAAVGNTVAVTLSAATFQNGDTLIIYDTSTARFLYGTVTAGGGTTAITIQIGAGSAGLGGQTMAAGARVIANSGGNNGNNYFDVDGINGNTLGTTGIIYDGFFGQQNYFRSKSSFGAVSPGKYIAAVNGGLGFNNAYDLQLYTGAGSLLPGYAGYGALSSPCLYVSSSNAFRILSGSLPAVDVNIGSGYAALTAANSRASFNAGLPVYAQRFLVTMNIPTLSAGQVADFYIYSPYTTGTSQHTMIPTVLNTLAPIVLEAITDNSLANANEIRIRVVAIAAITGPQAVSAMITVGM